MLVEPSPATSRALHARAAGGLAAQPVPLGSGRGRACLRPRRTARQRECGRHRVGHHLAVAAQAFTRHGLGMPARNPEAVRQRTIEAARQRTGRPATQALTRCSSHSTPAPSPPENGHRLSCMSGSAGMRSTPSWAPTWWSSCTARATPVNQPLGPGRSSAGPIAATGWPANAPAVPSAAKPGESTALADPTSSRSERWQPMPADPLYAIYGALS
jgi:hypothetical protein